MLVTGMATKTASQSQTGSWATTPKCRRNKIATRAAGPMA